ncbi:hypothetical protein G7009_00660 [Pseudomonas capeferrum]|nr:hypothetical protein [Pseudomonas capeferrum]
MAGIAAVTPGAIAPAAEATQNPRTGKAGEGASTAAVDLSQVRGRGAGKSQPAEDQSGEPAHIKQLREQIKQLQKQLAEEQKQLAALMKMNKGTDDSGKLAAVSAKQASIATLNGEILSATAALLEALNASGTSSAGGMLSTQA